MRYALGLLFAQRKIALWSKSTHGRHSIAKVTLRNHRRNAILNSYTNSPETTHVL